MPSGAESKNPQQAAPPLALANSSSPGVHQTDQKRIGWGRSKSPTFQPLKHIIQLSLRRAYLRFKPPSIRSCKIAPASKASLSPTQRAFGACRRRLTRRGLRPANALNSPNGHIERSAVPLPRRWRWQRSIPLARHLASNPRRNARNPPAEGEGGVEQVNGKKSCLMQKFHFCRRAEQRQTFNHHLSGGHGVRNAEAGLLAEGSRPSQPAFGIPDRWGMVRDHRPCTGLQALADSLKRLQPLASIKEMQCEQARCSVERAARRLFDRPF